MKRIYTLIVLALLPVSGLLKAQQGQPYYDKCLADIIYKQQIAADPQFAANQARLEQETAAYTDSYMARHNNAASNRNTSVVRVIPVVFHIIHEGGVENISRAQCLNQIEILNKDYRRLNADTANTPAPFKALSADAEIEFRIASLDPNGNCTDGVVRVYSPLTTNARDNVKALSYWPSNKYLNIWVVRSIENTNGGAGVVIGFAQFPGGNALTDGVVLRYDYTGEIGAAATTAGAGRTATHEVGHWLNLRHIWGDATCGTDYVNDTPTQEMANMSICPTFPHVSNCTGSAPNGDMFTNYMDYTNGPCQNQFSIGQAARMNAALSSSTSGRNNLWTTANLIATGTNGTTGALCAPVAAVYNTFNTICSGSSIHFTDQSWNGQVSSWQWDFPGGTPSLSTDTNPTIQYNTPGVYDVSLTVSNASGSSTVTLAGTVTVISAIGQNSVPYAEGFESIAFPGTDWTVTNEGGNAWTLSSQAAHTGTKALFLNNYTGNTANTSDFFLTPTYNLTGVTSANLTFWLAFAARSSTSTDALKVYASTTCGQLWNIRYNKTGTTLSTAGIISSNFTPTAAQWRQETVNIANSSYNNKPNVRFKFEYLQVSGNNIYVDDINLNGTVGMDEVFEQSLDFAVSPNPVIGAAHVDFVLNEKGQISIDVIDVAGRVVNRIAENRLDAGEYRFDLPEGLSSGIYSVRLNVDGYVTSRKIAVVN